MLTKLLHYEFRSTGRVVLPVAAGVLVLNLLTAVLAHFIQNTANRLPLVGFGMVLLTFASFISLLVVFVLCFFVEVRQFYRLLGDRGYLMLALPVQPWKHIAAKVICGTVWTLFGELFVSLCAASSILSYDAVDFSPFRPEDFWPYALMFLILVVCVAGALLHMYLACAFAAQFTQQRLLISICAYFVISFIGQAAALASVAIFASNVDFDSMSALLGGSGNVVAVGLLALLIVCILVDALLWALTQWFMTKRLNLA
jgi:hypothetical protein